MHVTQSQMMHSVHLKQTLLRKNTYTKMHTNEECTQSVLTYMHLILLVTIEFCNMDGFAFQWLEAVSSEMYLGVSSCVGPHDAELFCNGACVTWNLRCASSQDWQGVNHLPEGSMEEWTHEMHLREWEVWCLESLVSGERLSVHEDDRMIKTMEQSSAPMDPWG
jgi:hypothetical protein